MDKTNIKNFAIWARKKLIADSIYKASLLGISEKGIEKPLPQLINDTQLFDIGMKEPYAITGQEIRQRKKLVEAIQEKERNLEYKDAFQSVMEEVAYTWFNRLIAIRFMEVNDYMPSHIRVISSDNPGKTEPDLVTTPFDSDLLFSEKEKQQIINWKNENNIDDVFRMLFIKQCNALNDCLPMLFERISDYTELLLNVSVTDRDGIVWHLVHDIPEKNFDVNAIDDDGKPVGQVEIIGWFYQYYNTEPKDKVFADLKRNIKITRETIPAATQLFTPDWIVRYMVENSLGRLWVEGHPNDNLKNQWKYYLDEAKQDENVQKELDQIYAEHAQLKPEDIRCIDPCVGSGHIICYMFDILIQIYKTCGYSARDAVSGIVKNNIYGLDIDKRAAQLAYFSIMMKAQQYDRRFLTRHIQPYVFSAIESNDLDPNVIDYFVDERPELKSALNSLISDLHDAKEYGSILNVKPVDFTALYARFGEINDINNSDPNLYTNSILETLLPFVKVAEMLSQKYHVVCTNPPYMGSSGMSGKLSDYVKKNYPDSKSDLFAVFIEKCGQMVMPTYYQSMITQHAWMFLSSFENLRARILSLTIMNMAHLGARAFEEIGGEVVQTTSFVLRKSHIENYKGIYSRLIDPTTQQGKENMFLSGENRYEAEQSNFSKIPGSPVAYWASQKMLSAFAAGTPIGKKGVARNGMKTGDNGVFLRLWWECAIDEEDFVANSDLEAKSSGKKWFPYNKGGEFRKWYGNNDYVVNWENGGSVVMGRAKADGRHVQDYPDSMKFKPALTWSLITSSSPSFRYKAHHISDIAGMSVYSDEPNVIKLMGLLNTKVAQEILRFIAPTINFQAGDIARVPITNIPEAEIDIVRNSIKTSKSDWDSFETSWDFQRNPLIRKTATIKEAFSQWQQECDERFNQLKSNEEELNRIFIDIYGLQDELTPEEEDKDVTVRKADLGRDIRSFISYAVGCMFGRYSLDVDGLAYAGGDWDDSKYKTFIPDEDNVIPITDEEYLDDDIVGRFVRFVKVVYGDKTLEENLTFIADALGGKGKSSREVIRNYFLKDFFKDHCKTYQKRPIYWLYDSGKQNGFKALVYLHRMDENTTGKVRADYLHHIEQIYSNEAARMQDTMERSKSDHEVSVAEKRLEKLKKQIKECQDYDAKLGHLALDQIRLNLDDGVKVNYRKAQTGREGKFYEVLADSKNIMANDTLWKEYLTEWPHEEE